MDELIECRDCKSPSCKGCNIKILADMFHRGKFDGMMNGNRRIDNRADIVPVVRCKECKWWQDNNGGYPHEECRWGKDETPDPDDYCSFGERKDGE